MSRTPAASPLHGGALLRGRLPFSRRSSDTELLDAPDLDPIELAGNLRDLTRLNRLPGGASASIAAIEALLGGVQAASILDVGTGAGDLPAHFARHARRQGWRWRVIALDNRAEVLHHAAPVVGDDVDIALIRGEAADLPLEDASVDVVHSSLLLHHFAPEEAVAVLAEMRRVARRGVVVNDLRRGLLPFLLTAPLVLALGRAAMTRHDGLVSLRRAYTLRELDLLLEAAGLHRVWRSSRVGPRIASAAVAS